MQAARSKLQGKGQTAIESLNNLHALERILQAFQVRSSFIYVMHYCSSFVM